MENKKIIYFLCSQIPSRGFAWAFTTLCEFPSLRCYSGTKRVFARKVFWMGGWVSGEHVLYLTLEYILDSHDIAIYYIARGTGWDTSSIFNISPTPMLESKQTVESNKSSKY